MTQVDELNKQLTGHDGNARRVNIRPEAEPEEEPKALTVHTSPRQDVDIILLNQSAIQQLKKSMTYGVHYGPPYKNSKKDTLLKPGAEWAQKLFGIRPQYEEIEAIIQPNFDDLAKSWISFRYRCQMVEIATGNIVGEAIGTCHSLEDKYHWRNGQLQCPHCGQETLIVSKRNQSVYWCNTYNGGCGKETPKNAPEITSQQIGKVPNANPMDLANTLDKIAQKRAYVSAVLNATAASSIFAPGDDAIDDIDVSDIIEAEYTEAPTSPTPPTTTPKPESKPEPEAPTNLEENIKQIAKWASFMYDHPNHADNSVKKMFENGELSTEDTITATLWKIFEHRIKSKPYNLTVPEVCEILTKERIANGSNVPVGSLSQYAKDGGTRESAWEAVVAYHENANRPPAKAKAETAETPPPVGENDVPF